MLYQSASTLSNASFLLTKDFAIYGFGLNYKNTFSIDKAK